MISDEHLLVQGEGGRRRFRYQGAPTTNRRTMGGRNRTHRKTATQESVHDPRNNVRSARDGGTTAARSPTADSAANGLTEKGVQEFEDILGTWLPATQENYQADVPRNAPNMKHLVE